MTPNNKKNLLLVGAAVAIYFLWNKKKKECEKSGGGGAGGGTGASMPSPSSPTFPMSVLPNTPTQTNISVTTCPAGQIAQNGVCVPDTSSTTTGTSTSTPTTPETITTPNLPACDKGQKLVNGQCVPMTCEDRGLITYNGSCYTAEEICKLKGGIWSVEKQTCMEVPIKPPTTTISTPKIETISPLPTGSTAQSSPILTTPTTTITNPKTTTTVNPTAPIGADIAAKAGFAQSNHPFFVMPSNKKDLVNKKPDFFNVKKGFK